MARLNTATITRSHQRGSCPCPPKRPRYETTAMPTSHGNSHELARTSSGGLSALGRRICQAAITMRPMAIPTYSFQIVPHGVKYTIISATTKDSGERIPAAGSRKGRSRPGSRSRRAANVTGAEAYISTVAEVTKPTSDCQPGNGRKNTHPATHASAMETQGTPRLESHA